MIRLKYQKTSAEINKLGAELKSLKLDSGREIMWEANPFFWGRSSPVLFPIVGPLRNGKTVIDGIEYEIPKHGFARNLTFSASQIAENDVTFTLTENEETLKCFPFKFSLKLHYRLFNDKIKIRYTVKNNSDKTMPYCIGGHPAFACPFDKESEFQEYMLIFEHKETVNSPLFDAGVMMFNGHERTKRLANSNEFHLAHNLFINDAIYFDTITSQSVLLTADRKTGIKLSWSGFETLGVWTPEGKNAPFVCLEPWCGSADFTSSMGLFVEKPGIQLLEPGMIKKYEMTIAEIV